MEEIIKACLEKVEALAAELAVTKMNLEKATKDLATANTAFTYTNKQYETLKAEFEKLKAAEKGTADAE